MTVLMVPLVALSWLAGPVGGIWLIIRGEWWAIGYAVLSLLLSTPVLGIALMPTMLLVAPVALAAERRPGLAVLLGLPALLYTAALMTLWGVGVLLFFLSRGNSRDWLPLSLLACTVGMGPWVYMSSKETQADPGRGSDGAAFATMFMTAAYLVAIALLAFDHARPLSANVPETPVPPEITVGRRGASWSRRLA